MNLSAGRATRGVLLLVAVAAVGAASRQTAEGWQTFEGSWNAAGERELLAVGNGRSAATIRLSGALVITGNTGLRRSLVRWQAVASD